MLPYLRFKRASILEHAEQMRKMIQKVGDEIYTENNSDINTYAPFIKKYNSRLKASGVDKSANKNNAKNEGNDTHNSNEDEDNINTINKKEYDDNNDDNDDDDDDEEEEEMIREREKAKAKVKEEARKARKMAAKGDNNSSQGKIVPDNNDTSNTLKLENKKQPKKGTVEDDFPTQDTSDDIFAYRPNVGNKALTDFLGSSDEEEKPSTKVIEKKSKVKKSNFDEPILPVASNSGGLKKTGLQRVGRKSKTAVKSSTDDTEPEIVNSNITTKPTEIIKSEIANSITTKSTEIVAQTMKTVIDVKLNKNLDSDDEEYSIQKNQSKLSISNKKDDSLSEFLDSDNEESNIKLKNNKTKSIIDIELHSHNLNVKSEENISIGNEKVIEDKEEEIVKISGTLRRPRKNKTEEKSKSTISNTVIMNNDNKDDDDDDDDGSKVKIQSVLRRPRKVKSSEAIVTEVNETDRVQNLDQKMIEVNKAENIEQKLVIEKHSHINNNVDTIDNKSTEINVICETVITELEKDIIIEYIEVNDLNNDIVTLVVDDSSHSEIKDNVEIENNIIEIEDRIEVEDHIEIENHTDIKIINNDIEVENANNVKYNNDIDESVNNQTNVAIDEINNVTIELKESTNDEDNIDHSSSTVIVDNNQIDDIVNNQTNVAIDEINNVTIELKESINVEDNIGHSSSTVIVDNNQIEKVKDIDDELESFIVNDEDNIFDEIDNSIITKTSTIDIIKNDVKIENIPTTKNIKKKSTISYNFNDDDEDEDDDVDMGIGIKNKNFKDLEDDETDKKIDFKNVIINNNNKGNTASLNNAISQIMSSFQQQIVNDDDDNHGNDNDNDEKKKKKKKEKKAKKEKKEKKKSKKIQSDEEDSI